jgi:uncharacterized protein YjbI with pentapeptide repeats
MAVRSVDWETCGEDECVGVRLPSGGRCWAHANDHDLEAALQRLGEGGELNGRGVTFTAELLQRLLDASPHDDHGRTVVSAPRFEGATFKGNAVFEGATFKGNAVFHRATFTGHAEFRDATFTDMAFFGDATFTGTAGFTGATFGDAGFFNVTFKGGAGFGGATFESAHFSGSTFTVDANFTGASFAGDANFGWATLESASFTGATLTGDASFIAATFTGDASFIAATFTGEAGFDSATFESDAQFSNATFRGFAWFAKATFESDAQFDRATFESGAWFDWATFEGGAQFDTATFTGRAEFASATFERAQQLGPVLVHDLVLNRALFRERIQIEVSAADVSCERARFLAGVQLRVRWAQVVLDDADLSAPSLLSRADPFPDLDEGDWRPVPGNPWPVDADGTPRLLSVRGANVAGLTVAAVDLKACRFAGAHRLDQLRAEGSKFARTPPGWRWTKRRTIWRWTKRRTMWRWSTRRTIAEEQQWRASQGDDPGWYGPANQPPDLLQNVRPLTPAEIAPLYRDLRKGLEDNKDEPGAADFYYGEMEMRRHDESQKALPERAILTLYWLVSGYGLRAWRALATLAAVVLIASAIFAAWGFTEPDKGEFSTALLFSTQATTALLRGPAEGALTETGQWVQIALRLIGPVLLGLAVLSVRGRVKR